MSAPELLTGMSAITTPECTETDASPQIPDHLVPLSDDWALWRWVAVRGSGFPVSQAEMIAAPATTAAADVWLAQAENAERCREAAVQATRDDLTRADLSDKRKLQRVLDRLHNIDPIRLVLPSAVVDRCPAYVAACASARTAYDDYRAVFTREMEGIADELSLLGQQDRFREAILWQNRAAVHSALEPMREHRIRGERRNHRQRGLEQLIASYLLRYTTKNDTIGFFGPVGWATVSTTHQGLTVRPGPQLVADRNVYFESWGMDALVAALIKDPRLESWFLPRRAHTIDIDAGMLISADGPSMALSRGDEALLLACDGDTTVREMTARVSADPSLELSTEADVLARLHEFRDRAWITHTLALPMEMYPDRTLARLLGRIDDEQVRASALAGLTEMRDARARIAAAAGRPADLDVAIGALEETFTRLTGTAPTRAGGTTYGARTLVYEDCRRDLDVVIGRDVLRALAPPLELMLTSGRWMTFETAARYTSLFTGMYRELAQAAGSDTIPFAGFLEQTLGFVLGQRNRGPALEVQVEFQKRWERVLDPPEDRSRVQYSSEQLRPLVAEAFSAPGPGWQFGRYHSPDVLIAAQSAAHVTRGDYLLVLGELHTGTNTLGCPLFMEQHPDVDALRRAGVIDLAGPPRLEPIIPKFFWPGQATRALATLDTPTDYRLELAPDPSGVDPSRVLPVSRLRVSQARDQLVVHTRDRELEFDLTTVMAQLLTWLVVGRFKLLPTRAHQPRLTVDRVVIARESWSFAPKDLQFAFEHDEVDRFLGARRLVRRYGLPRDVFARVPTEKKPFLVDLTSPTCVNILSKAIRLSAENKPPTARVTFSEMLPAKHETWLVDSDGHGYTAELRMAAVDRRSRASMPS